MRLINADSFDVPDSYPAWISVKDELPNYRENVIVFTEKHIDVGHLARGRYGSLWWERDSIDVWKDNEILRDVTHWMPLPKEPKTDGRKESTR